ncbi:hypothetical protein HZB03_03130 [Candidatus Woesearchaeota archaeon]|nr:hypothetical protein [Candidatus Woesearchaeota archaeon]
MKPAREPAKESYTGVLAADILRKYNGIVERRRAAGKCFFNGCQQRAVGLLDELKGAGADGFVMVVNSIDCLVHESGAFFHFHHVAFTWDGLVFDPNYSKARPLPLEDYIREAYSFPSNILIWKRGCKARPIGRYDETAHRVRLDADFAEELSQRRLSYKLSV